MGPLGRRRDQVSSSRSKVKGNKHSNSNNFKGSSSGSIYDSSHPNNNSNHGSHDGRMKHDAHSQITGHNSSSHHYANNNSNNGEYSSSSSKGNRIKSSRKNHQHNANNNIGNNNDYNNNASHHNAAHPGSSSRNNGKSSNNHNDPNQTQSNAQPQRRKKILDPTLLARGMSARHIGARISKHVRPLSPSNEDEIEKDLRHMEAYGAACIAYAQQFFLYTNRDLVNKGKFGPVPVRPAGVSQTEVYATAGSDGTTDPNNAVANAGTPNKARNNANAVMPGGGIRMPIKIDPEEEKRLSLLRRRVAASEAKREVLETEYLSLRAHYVHESHRFRRTRKTVSGTLKFLRELGRRKSRVLALCRVRCAVARDALESLEFRAKALEAIKNGAGGGSAIEATTPAPTTATATATTTVSEPETATTETTADSSATAMEGVEETTTTTTDATPDSETDKPTTATTTTNTSEKDSNQSQSDKEKDDKESDKKENKEDDDSPNDLIDIWNDIERQLHEAELDCSRLETPVELLQVKHLSSQAAETAAEMRVPFDTLSGKPSTVEEDEENNATASGGAKAKKKGKGNANTTDSGGTKGGGEGKGKNKSHKKSSSSSTPNTNGGGATGPNDDVTSPVDDDDDVIPWTCQVMPRTPYDVSVFLSNLSKTPDWGAAFATGGIFGSKDTSMLWLESNLPKTFVPKMQEESEELLQLREEVRLLTEELNNDVSATSESQKELIANRKRNDELAAMMSMLRTETEAVLNRHNILLDTPEARRASQLHAENQNFDGGDYAEEDELDDEDALEEEGELDEGDNDKSSDGGTVIEEEEGEEINDDVDQNPFGLSSGNVASDNNIESDSAEEGEIQEVDEQNDGDDEDEGNSDEGEEGEKHPMREVIVPRLGGGHGDGESKTGTLPAEGDGLDKIENGAINEEAPMPLTFTSRIKRAFTESVESAIGSEDRSQKRRRERE